MQKYCTKLYDNIFLNSVAIIYNSYQYKNEHPFVM